MSAYPFVLVLLSIALLPQLLTHLWEHRLARPALLAALAAPAIVGQLRSAPAGLWHAGVEYVGFIALLGCLFVIAGGLVLEGAMRRGTAVNVAILALGAASASVLGTTGASMLLVRPYLRANAGRRHTAHLVVFFIFLVSNLGGLLLPLGDPPLYLGYLRGVPFTWTLSMWPAWALGCGALLLVFAVLDRALGDDAAAARPDAAAMGPAAAAEGTGTLRLRGRRNLLLFAALIALIVGSPAIGLSPLLQAAAMLALAALARLITPPALYAANGFAWAPLIEVAQVFLAIFATMPPAMRALMAVAPAWGPQGAEGLFWLTGSLSAVLDNAPCYLMFATLAATQLGLDAADLGALAAHPQGATLLRAISLGAVAMGAMSYIGNGPNLMVRAIAAQAGARPPSFLGYLAWSMGILLPVLVALRALSV